MKSLVEPAQDREAVLPAGKEEIRQEAVLQELDRILSSRFFRSAIRCRQFLEYVVRNSLDGKSEQLKERTIGTEVFHRPAGYATGDDAVVRVQAGEVRRRLGQYYLSAPADSQIRIELPVGSYSPQFKTGPFPAAPESVPASVREITADVLPKRRPVWAWVWTAVSAVILVGIGVAIHQYRTPAPQSTLRLFWNPVLMSREPLLICLAKPVAYRPNESIYRRYSKTHPGTFQTEAERTNTPLPLDPDEKLTWGDFFVYTDYGVAGGDVYAAVALSGLMGKFDKPTQVRIGNNYSYEDLRNSPAVVVGGFNNKWTMQLTANLRYAFIEDHEQYMIREQTPGGKILRTKLNDDGDTVEDYGIVSRLTDSKTGQFTVTVSGIGPMGTQAAGELVSNSHYLEKALSDAPQNWQNRNLELVLHTIVTDGVPGPPQVVSTTYW